MANKTKEEKNTTKKTATKNTNTNATTKSTTKDTANKTVNTAQKKNSAKKTTTKKSMNTASKKANTTKKSSTSSSSTKTKSTTTKKKTAPKKTTTTKKAVKEKVLETTTPEVIQELHVTESEVEVVTEVKSDLSKNDNIPKTILGIDLPDGKDDEDRRIRKKYYMKDALIFAIIIPVLDLFAMLFIESYEPLLITDSTPLNFVITLGIDFILIYIVTYLIDFVFGEDAVKKNNK